MIQDYSQKFKRDLKLLACQNVELAANAFLNDVKLTLNRDGRRSGKRAKKAAAILAGTRIKNRSVSVKRGSTGNLLGLQIRSRPGEPPRKQTGLLLETTAIEVNRFDCSARVGPSRKYGFWLELGTRKMAARPFMVPTLNKNRIRYGIVITNKKLVG